MYSGSDKRIDTSKKGEKILEKIGDFTKLEFSVIAKIAVSLSLLESNKIEPTEYDKYDNKGKNLRKVSVFGDDDILFDSVLCFVNGRKLEPSEFFGPKSLSKVHIERGLELLESIMEDSDDDKLKFYDTLVSKVKIPDDFEKDIKSDQLKIKIGKDLKDHEDVYLDLNNSESHPNSHLAIMVREKLSFCFIFCQKSGPFPTAK